MIAHSFVWVIIYIVCQVFIISVSAVAHAARLTHRRYRRRYNGRHIAEGPDDEAQTDLGGNNG